MPKPRKCSTPSCKNQTTKFQRCARCRAADRKRRETLKARGVCVRCEVRKAVEGHVSCKGCMEFDRERNMRRRRKNLAKGLCASCGEAPPREGKRTCAPCGSSHLVAAAKGLCCRCRNTPATIGRFCLECKKKRLAWEERHVSAGLCLKCHQFAVDGLLHCSKHRASDKVRTRARAKKLKAEGKCYICMAPSFGKTRCPAHQKRHTAEAKARREELRAKGLCDCCGKRPYVLNYRRCEECLERKRVKRRSRTPEQIKNDRARSKRVREEAVAKGICYRCSKNPATGGRKTCDECTEIQRIRTAITAAKSKKAKKAAMVEPERLAKLEARRRAKQTSRATTAVIAE